MYNRLITTTSKGTFYNPKIVRLVAILSEFQACSTGQSFASKVFSTSKLVRALANSILGNVLEDMDDSNS